MVYPEYARTFYGLSVINAKALSERIGMNQSFLSQYIKGTKKPSASQTKRILNGVQQIGRELSEVQFLL
jgi:transcriptional regulator with XRE-family HTH domain